MCVIPNMHPNVVDVFAWPVPIVLVRTVLAQQWADVHILAVVGVVVESEPLLPTVSSQTHSLVWFLDTS